VPDSRSAARVSVLPTTCSLDPDRVRLDDRPCPCGTFVRLADGILDVLADARVTLSLAILAAGVRSRTPSRRLGRYLLWPSYVASVDFDIGPTSPM
jgi:hypothetical protein